MEQQIQQAVGIALSGTADPSLKNQALDFVNQVKATQEGYKTCLGLLQSENCDAGLRFFIYQVIDDNIDKLDDSLLYELNGLLFKHLGSAGNDLPYLRNKLADLFARLFCRVYPQINAAFLKTLIESARGYDLNSVDYLLRISISIHFAIGDKLLARPKEEIDRNTVLKDLVRERDMVSLVESWRGILANVKEPDLLVNALRVIGFYVDWMELGLFVADGFISELLRFLKEPQLRGQTCLLLVEIISKKMKPQNKLELVLHLALLSVFENTDDVEYAENLAKLANQMGGELLIALENDDSLQPQVQAQLLALWPVVLGFLAHEFDDVLQQVFPFIQAYLLLAKKKKALAEPALLSLLLEKVTQKMQIEDDADDDDFLEFRARLKTFQDTVAVLAPPVYLDIVPAFIERLICGALWTLVEVGLYELGNFADLLKNNLISLPKAEILTLQPYQAVQDFLVKIINDFDLVTHPTNQLRFFELIVKHFSTKNFNNTTRTSTSELVFKIVELFTRGLFNPLEKVRLRLWYLFLRFVSATKPQFEALPLQQFVVKVQPLLEIKAQLPTRDEDDDLVEHGNFSSQLHLFEAVGTLVGLGQHVGELVDVLFAPLFAALEVCISREDRGVNALIALQAHHLLMAIASIVKGLEVQAPGKSSKPEVGANVQNAVQVVIITLENFAKFENVRDAARFAFLRFVPVLQLSISLQLSKLVLLILAAPNLRMAELGDFLGFVGQLVHLFRNNVTAFQLVNGLLTPLLQKVFAMLAAKDEYPDLVREKYELKRALMTFISTLVINSQFLLFLTETNRAVFPQVLSAVVEYACDLEEPLVAKLAVVQLVNVISLMGFNEGKVRDPKDDFAASLAPVPGVDDFLMEKAVKICFELPFDKLFNLRDAQFRNIAQDLLAVLATYQSRGLPFSGLLTSYLTNMGLAQLLATEFCAKLAELDAKAFKKYYVTFLTAHKS